LLPAWSDSSALISEVRQVAATGDPSEAQWLLGQFARQNSKNPAGWEAEFLLAGFAEKEKRIDDAIRKYRGVVAKAAQGEQAAASWSRLASIYGQQRHISALEEARGKLLQSFPESPYTAEVWLPLGKAALEGGDFRKAHEIFSSVRAPKSPEMQELAALSEVLATSSQRADELLDAAGRLMEANQIARARNLLEYWRKHFPKAEGGLEAATRLGWCHYLEAAKSANPKALEQAESLWRAVVATGPARDSWVRDAHWHLVQLHAGPKNDWKQAVEICREITKAAPEGSVHQEQALLARAWILLARSEYHAAQKAFEELEQAHPATAALAPVKAYREEIARALAQQ
jgi:tetratricopeptide (TPR) repeat protein